MNAPVGPCYGRETGVMALPPRVQWGARLVGIEPTTSCSGGTGGCVFLFSCLPMPLSRGGPSFPYVTIYTHVDDPLWPCV